MRNSICSFADGFLDFDQLFHVSANHVSHSIETSVKFQLLLTLMFTFSREFSE